MKLEPRRIAAFLRDPGATRCVLLHGDDSGLIRDRANQIARCVVPQLDDPFRVAVLEKDSHGRLEEEATAIAMTGGRRVVRIRDVGDSLAAPLKSVLDMPGDTLIILEAPDMNSRSKLRAQLEKADNAVTIGCYPEEGRALETAIRAMLEEHRVTVDAEAMGYLVRHLGADRAITASEISKLMLLVGDAGHIDLDAAQACIGDAASLSVDDALHAATAGDAAACDRALSLALGEGGTAVGLLRQAQTHLQKLHRARLLMETQGLSAEEAAKTARPPVFFRRLPHFTRALQIWSASALLRATAAMVAAERQCKRSGAPDIVICRDAFANLARGARILARGGGREMARA